MAHSLCKMIPTSTKKKNKAKIHAYNDKFAVSGTFTAMTSSGSSSAPKTAINKVNLGYDQPSKKAKFGKPAFDTDIPTTQSTDSGPRSQVSFYDKIMGKI